MVWAYRGVCLDWRRALQAAGFGPFFPVTSRVHWRDGAESVAADPNCRLFDLVGCLPARRRDRDDDAFSAFAAAAATGSAGCELSGGGHCVRAFPRLC